MSGRLKSDSQLFKDVVGKMGKEFPGSRFWKGDKQFGSLGARKLKGKVEFEIERD